MLTIWRQVTSIIIIFSIKQKPFCFRFTCTYREEGVQLFKKMTAWEFTHKQKAPQPIRLTTRQPVATATAQQAFRARVITYSSRCYVIPMSSQWQLGLVQVKYGFAKYAICRLLQFKYTQMVPLAHECFCMGEKRDRHMYTLLCKSREYFYTGLPCEDIPYFCTELYEHCPLTLQRTRLQRSVHKRFRYQTRAVLKTCLFLTRHM